MQYKHYRIFPILLLIFFITGCEDQNLEKQIKDSVVLSDVVVGRDGREWARHHPARQTKLGRSVGHIEVFENKAIVNCTGTILSSKFVLTAAHCVINPETNKAYRDIYFTPQKYYKDHMPHGRFPATKVYLPQKFLSATRNTFEATEYDMALVKFNKNARGENLTEKTQGAMSYWGADRLPSNKATTMGYPGDKNNLRAHVQENCEIRELNDLVYETDCDTYKGQSGSALTVYSDKYKNSHVHGVLAAENRQDHINQVTRITRSRQRIITAIAARNDMNEAHQQEEKWVELSTYTSQGVHIFVENDCWNKALSLYAGYIYRDKNGLEKSGLKRILPGRTVKLALNSGGSYMLGIKNIREDKVDFSTKRIAATYNHSKVGEIDFYKYNSNFSGDVVHTIRYCD